MAFTRRLFDTFTNNTRADRVLQAAASQQQSPDNPPAPPPSPTFTPPNMAAQPSSSSYGGGAGALGSAQNVFTGPQGLTSRPRTTRHSLLGEG